MKKSIVLFTVVRVRNESGGPKQSTVGVIYDKPIVVQEAGKSLRHLAP